MIGKEPLSVYFETRFGRIFHADSLDVMARCDTASVDLVMTGQPFALTHKKDYSNKQNVLTI